MDIEGAEGEVLLNTSADTLKKNKTFYCGEA